MSILKKWIISATADELSSLAKESQTSVAHLHHLVLGQRSASADLAGRIADAAKLIRNRSAKRKERLPELKRSDLCAACARCPHASTKV